MDYNDTEETGHIAAGGLERTEKTSLLDYGLEVCGM